MTPGEAWLKAISQEWSPAQVERFLAGVQRCKQELSSIPFDASRAAKDPEYWLLLCASQPLRYADHGPFAAEIEYQKQLARMRQSNLRGWVSDDRAHLRSPIVGTVVVRSQPPQLAG